MMSGVTGSVFSRRRGLGGRSAGCDRAIGNYGDGLSVPGHEMRWMMNCFRDGVAGE